MHTSLDVIVSGSYDMELSDQHRVEGNRLYEEGRFFAALAHYNHALNFSRSDKERAALCYVNRSAVYLKLNYYDHCLNNIRLAEPNYPAEKMKKLIYRREQCKKLKTEVPEKSIKPFVHSFKLSYEANKKIPYFIDAIGKVGDRIVTTKDLKAGDVIAILEPAWMIPINNLTANYVMPCYNCIGLNYGDLIPGKCSALFCSEKCLKEHKAKDIDHKAIHQLEKLVMEQHAAIVMVYRIFFKFYDLFGNTNELCKFVEAHENKKYHFFDFDWSIEPDSPEYLKNLLLLIINFGHKVGRESSTEMREMTVQFTRKLKENRFEEIFLNDSPRNLRFIDRLLVWILCSCDVEFKFVAIEKENVLANICHPALSLLGSSCDPNVFGHLDCNKRIVWTANQPIQAGSELSGCPTNGTPYYRQQTKLCKRDINCLPCKKGWSSQINHLQVDVDTEVGMAKFFKQHDPAELSGILEHIQECSDFINSNFDGYYKKDSQTRQKIAAKKEELRKSLNSVACPLPAYGLP